LHATIARKITEQPRTHLPGRKRERGDRNREDGTRDADRRRSDRAEQRSSARSSAAIEKPAAQECRRKRAAAVDLDEDDGAAIVSAIGHFMHTMTSGGIISG